MGVNRKSLWYQSLIREQFQVHHETAYKISVWDKTIFLTKPRQYSTTEYIIIACYVLCLAICLDSLQALVAYCPTSSTLLCITVLCYCAGWLFSGSLLLLTHWYRLHISTLHLSPSANRPAIQPRGDGSGRNGGGVSESTGGRGQEQVVWGRPDCSKYIDLCVQIR